jgi:hypothetical protein
MAVVAVPSALLRERRSGDPGGGVGAAAGNVDGAAILHINLLPRRTYTAVIRELLSFFFFKSSEPIKR